jgi:ABC-2 type transport system permease protein
MNRILVITVKDLTQMLRDRKTFMFLLIMPIIFTVLFGFALGGPSDQDADSRLPVGFSDQDNSRLSSELRQMLDASKVIRLVENPDLSNSDLEKQVEEGDLKAALVIPAGYGEAAFATPLRLTLINNPSDTASLTIQGEISRAANRVLSAARTASSVAMVSGDSPTDAILDQALEAWANPPIRVETQSGAVAVIEEASPGGMSAAHSSPGMMLQFAIAGLLTCAQVIVNERKSRSLQRLLTTATRRVHILLGHYLAIFVLIFAQFILLIAFGQLFLGVDYLSAPLGTLLVAFTSALCIAALGLLIGVLAKSDEQAIIFSLIPMFLFAGLGGAWTPLEYTNQAFQTIGHLTPVAWAMDGFKNIIVRDLGFESTLLPAGALAGYALLFFVLAAWRLQRSEMQ